MFNATGLMGEELGATGLKYRICVAQAAQASYTCETVRTFPSVNEGTTSCIRGRAVCAGMRRPCLA